MRYGEIIELGRHKLMCGDATSRDDVMSFVDGVKVDLVLTDPPYGIKVQRTDGRIGSGGYSPQGKYYPSPKYPQMINDDNAQCARDNYAIIKKICGRLIMWGANNFCDILPMSNGWLVWDKRVRLKNSFSHCELAWTNVTGAIKLYAHEWCGCFREGSYKLNPRPRVHVTQKPVELHMRILEDFSKPGDIILDCFGGSGTTLIACEMTGRKCLMMEISPEYCDIIAERYNKLMYGKLPLEVANA